MRRALVFVLALVLAFGPAGATVAEDIASFERDQAMTHVRKLARKIGVRVRGTKKERRASKYIAGVFESYGYDVKIQKFPVDGKKSRNVVATWPGGMNYPIVIGGHMDSVPGAPGANDNASGVAVTLEIARLVAGTPKAKYFAFVAFGSEEYGTNGLHHVGSQIYVNRLRPKGRKKTPGMISVDMIADGRPLIVGTAGIGPAIVARTFNRRAKKANIATDYRITCDCSDNGPFERAGIPAAFLWSGDEPNYHLPSDTVANLKPKDLVRTGRAVRAFVNAVNWAMIRRLRKH
jgi:aminopeptidase YwaD